LVSWVHVTVMVCIPALPPGLSEHDGHGDQLPWLQLYVRQGGAGGHGVTRSVQPGHWELATGKLPGLWMHDATEIWLVAGLPHAVGHGAAWEYWHEKVEQTFTGQGCDRGWHEAQPGLFSAAVAIVAMPSMTEDCMQVCVIVCTPLVGAPGAEHVREHEPQLPGLQEKLMHGPDDGHGSEVVRQVVWPGARP